MSVRRRTIPLVEDSPRKMSLCESHPNTGQVCLCRLHFSQVCVPQFYRSLLKRWQNLQPCDMIITLGCVTLFFKQPLEGKPFTHVSWEGIHKYWLDIEWPIFLVQSHSHHHQDVNQSAGFLSNSRRCKNTPPTTKKTLIAPAPLCFLKPVETALLRLEWGRYVKNRAVSLIWLWAHLQLTEGEDFWTAFARHLSSLTLWMHPGVFFSSQWTRLLRCISRMSC